MVAAKERFLGLEKEIAAKGDWSHEEEDAIRDTIEDLEKDFAIYLVEASQPSTVAELTQISETTGEDDRVVYTIAKSKADKETGADWSFVERTAPGIEGKENRQLTGDVAMLYRHARACHGDFEALIKGVAEGLGGDAGVEAKVAPLKHLYRIVEKKEFSTHYPGRADGVCDIVRALFKCTTKAAMAKVYEALLTHPDLVVVRGKDRWTKPTPGGWADHMLNFRLKSDRNRHIVEVQIVHHKLMIAREGLDGHAAYAQGRAATETLEVLEAQGRLSQPQLAQELGQPHLAQPEQPAPPQPAEPQPAPPPPAVPATAAVAATTAVAIAAPTAQAMSARVAPEEAAADAGKDFPGKVNPETLAGTWCCYCCGGGSCAIYKIIPKGTESYLKKGLCLCILFMIPLPSGEEPFHRIPGTNSFQYTNPQDGKQTKVSWEKDNQAFTCENGMSTHCKVG